MPTVPSATETTPLALDAPELYINRELSWLAFNARVLAQAADPRQPLLERVKFLAIVGTNLDEFFMIRVATLQKQMRTGRESISPDGLTTASAADHRAGAGAGDARRAGPDVERQLRPELAGHGIAFLDPSDYTDEIATYLRDYFAREIAPVLTPLAFDPGHPFPHISNLSKNLAVVVKHDGRTKFARVKVPPVLPRFIALPARLRSAATTFAFLEDVVCANVQALFPGTQVKGAHLFRIIRDTDMVIQEDEADDLLETIDQGLRQLRHGAPSMLQVEQRTPRRVVDILVENFEIDEGVLVRTTDRLGFSDWMELTSLHRPELKYPAFVPRVVWGRAEAEEVFELVRHRDHMVHHPFDSFTSVERLLQHGGRRSRRRRDQDDAVPHRPRFAAGRSAGRGRGSRQAGRGAGRAEGAVRREEQHRVGEPAGRSGRPRRLRPGEPEDALQAVPDRAQGARRHPALRAHRHRQLQRVDRARCTPTSACSPRVRRSSKTCPTSSTI